MGGARLSCYNSRMSITPLFRRKKLPDQPEPSIGADVLSLSLFILLLAFFIVLNSITSLQNDRIDPVLQSLWAAFGRDMQTLSEKPSPQQDEFLASGAGDSQTQIAAMLRAQIPSVSIERSVARGTLRARVSVPDLTASIGHLTPEKLRAATPENRTSGSLLPILAGLMIASNNTQPLRLDIVLAASQGTVEDIAYLEKLAMLLEAAGVPKTHYAVSYTQEGARGFADFVFTPYASFAPDLPAPEDLPAREVAP